MRQKRQILLVKGIANFKPAFKGFSERGFEVKTVNLNLAEINRRAKETPSIIVVLYFNDSVFEIANVTECPIVVWLADKVVIGNANNLGIDLARFYLFSFDPEDILAFKKSGMDNCWYMPCNSGFEFSGLKECRYKDQKYDISFVGESITVKHNPYFQLMLNFSKMMEHINTTVDEQVSRFTENLLAETFEKGYTDQFSIQFMLDFLKLLDRRELDFIIGCEASSRLRKKLVRTLQEFDLHIFGDDFWSDIETGYIKIHKAVSYPEETAEIYSQSKINLNISRVFFSGIIQRVYDIIYCGGFCVTDYRADLSNCFEPDREIVFYKSPEELKKKVCYYLKNPEERNRIAKAGYDRLMKDHRAALRIDFILSKLDQYL